MATNAGTVMPSFKNDFAALSRFRKALGQTASEAEVLGHVRISLAKLDSTVLSGVDENEFVDSLVQCYAAFGSHLTFKILAAQDEQALVNAGDPKKLWPEVGELVQLISEVQMELELNKQSYLAARITDTARQRTFIFNDSLALCSTLRMLLDKPSDFETTFWGNILEKEEAASDLPQLAIIVVNTTGSSRGEYISVHGGEIEPEVVHITSAASAKGQEGYCFQRAKEKLYWEVPWFKSLGPRHLSVEADHRNPSHADIFRATDAHLVNICLLYLANRSWTIDQKIVARFSSDLQQIDVELFCSSSEIGGIEELQARQFLMFTEFAYETERFNDRLRFAQAAFGRTVWPADSLKAVNILNQASRIQKTADWTWRSFCEQRIENFKKDTEDVDKDVRSTLEQFDSNTTKLVEDMSKTVLSAIGAVITAFIAAGLKKETNAQAFQIVMAGFFLYLVFVAGWMGLGFTYDRFKATRRAFGEKRIRHEAMLGDTRVSELIGKVLQEAETRFKHWFQRSLCIYILFAVADLVLIFFAPRLLY